MNPEQAYELLGIMNELKLFIIPAAEDMPTLYSAVHALVIWAQGLFIALSVLIFLQALAVFRRR